MGLLSFPTGACARFSDGSALHRVASAVLVASLALPLPGRAMNLHLGPASSACAAPAAAGVAALPWPEAAAQRLPESQVARGQGDIAWAWLGTPTQRYPHRALGSPVHAASLHVQPGTAAGAGSVLALRLPLHRVYEDRVPRIVDLDRDGRDEIVLIEADALRGASLVVLGIDQGAEGPAIVERARSAFVGSPFRWLNPVGVADFDADGRLDLAMVRTPHIGGELQLLHYRPPALVPYARAMDVSNHRMGALEQSLAVIVQTAHPRPVVVLPDMSLRALHALRWDAPGRWTELSDVMPLPGRIERMSPAPGAACVWLDDGRVLEVRPSP